MSRGLTKILCDFDSLCIERIAPSKQNALTQRVEGKKARPEEGETAAATAEQKTAKGEGAS